MIVACCLFKFFPYGGLSRDFVRISRELIKRGHQVRSYVQEWEGNKIEGIEVFELKCSAHTNDGKIHQYCDKLHEHLKNNPVDVILGFNKMPGLDFYFVADVCYRGKVEAEKKGIKGILYKLTPRYRNLRFFEESVFDPMSKTRILFLDESQRDLFDPYFKLEEKSIYILPPGISQTCDKSNYSMEDIERYRAKLGLASNMKMVVQVGSDFERKGVLRTLKGVASLPQELLQKTHLFVIGKDAAEAYVEKAKKLGIQGNVHFLGGLNNAELAIASADLLVHPAFVENTGTVILEAIALNTPQIVTENCGYSKYVSESKAGIVVRSPFQQDEFNSCLQDVLSDECLIASFRSSANKYCNKKNFSELPIKVAEILENFNVTMKKEFRS